MTQVRVKDETSDKKQKVKLKTKMPTLRKIKRAIFPSTSRPKTAHLILAKRSTKRLSDNWKGDKLNVNLTLTEN